MGNTIGRYSIGHVEKLTGVTSHTLRVWEKRYGFPVPSRTDGGARRYSEEDVARLKIIMQLLDSGYRAGDVVGLADGDLSALVRDPHQRTTPGEAPSLEDLLQAVMNNDLDGLRDRLRQAVAVHGPKAFVVNVAAPLITQIGDLWATGEVSIQQEHLASELLSTQMRVLLWAYEAQGSRPRILLTTLPDEVHGLGMEMVALYLAASGAGVHMLGRSTPVEEIVDAAVKMQADVVGLSVSVLSEVEPTVKGVNQLMELLPRRVALWVGGEGSKKAKIAELEAKNVASWEAVDAELAGWRNNR